MVVLSKTKEDVVTVQDYGKWKERLACRLTKIESGSG